MVRFISDEELQLLEVYDFKALEGHSLFFVNYLSLLVNTCNVSARIHRMNVDATTVLSTGFPDVIWASKVCK